MVQISEKSSYSYLTLGFILGPVLINSFFELACCGARNLSNINFANASMDGNAYAQARLIIIVVRICWKEKK